MEALPLFTFATPMDVAVVLEPLSSFGLFKGSFLIRGRDVLGVPSLLGGGGSWLSIKLEGCIDVPSGRIPI